MGSALLIAWVWISSQEVLSQRAAVSEGSQAWLNTLAVQSASPLVFDDAKAASEILRATSIYPGLQAAYILRSDGSTMAHHLGEAQAPLSPEALKLLPSSAYFDRSLLISTPVLLSHEQVGRVVAKIDLTPMWRSVLRFGLSLLLALGLSGIVAALAARRFLHRALQPLAGLKQVMDEVAQQERFTVRAALVANDEVGDLSLVFNHMLDQIVKRDGLLEDNNRHLLALKEAAEQASTTKSAFLAMMSHELRTPMAGILGMLKLSLRGQMEATVRERVELACKNANTLLQIVNDLLDGSKIEAGKLSLESVDFALQPLLDEAMQLLQERAEQKSIGFALHMDPRLPAFLKGDPTRLRQVLLNLVGNAIKFTEQGGVSVNVRLQPPPDHHTDHGPGNDGGDEALWVHFAVQDSGIGISEEAQGRMFQKFEQADMSTTRNFGGTGLGLSICKQLVELMGGHIGMRSKLGGGSTFYFDLPLLPGQQPAEAALEVLLPHEHQLHVLIAEDAETNQLIIKAVLSEMGHTFTLVNNGEKALEALTQESFDLILMDGRMPVMDGLEATQHIRAGFWRDWVFAERDIPIIALTANASEMDRSKFLAVGMSDFLRKPVDEAALHQALNRVIEQRKAQGLMLKPRASSASELAADLAGLDALLDTPPPEAAGAVTSGAAEPAKPASSPARAQRVVELREQMLLAFRAQAPLRYREIEAAIANKDWPAAAILAHGIKGCLAFIEPQGQAYDLSDWLERMADNEDEDEFIESFALLKRELQSSLDIQANTEVQP